MNVESVRTVERLRALALRITASAPAADAVVEQTLLEATRAGDARRPAADALALATRCRALALVRSGRWPPTAACRVPRGPAAPAPDAAAEKAFARAVAALDPHERRALDLACFEGYDIAEIARALGETAGVLRARLARTLACLAAALERTAMPGENREGRDDGLALEALLPGPSVASASGSAPRRYRRAVAAFALAAAADAVVRC
jgi:DNA-directed RNA polymerase specialized sigma24 family protein